MCGSGFLGSALTTAAGVAGGVVAGNVLMDMFSGHGGGMGGGSACSAAAGLRGGMPMHSETTIINNYGDGRWRWRLGQCQGSGGAVDPAWDNSTQGDSAAAVAGTITAAAVAAGSTTATSSAELGVRVVLGG